MEQLEEHIQVCKERIEKVLDQEGFLAENFLSCELMPYNETYMDRIQAAESSEELIALWRDIAQHSFLNWYVNPEVPEDAVADFIALGDVAKQRQLLAELLDKNQLYVNLSEIEDADFDVSEENKTLNKAFYGRTKDV